MTWSGYACSWPATAPTAGQPSASRPPRPPPAPARPIQPAPRRASRQAAPLAALIRGLQPLTGLSREAIQQAIIGKVADLLSGPGGLASFLRTRQLGARLAGPSLPLDIGYQYDPGRDPQRGYPA